MKALITGAAGQVGRELVEASPAGWTVAALTRAELDIGDAAATQEAVKAIGPQIVFNAAAYTAVDKAESDSESAFHINRDGAENVARASAAAGARLVHISTDFVFDGRTGTPYRTDAPTGPASVYGASKLAGERAVAQAAPDALIVRSAWVYAARGSNFLRTMLRLMAERPVVRVVSDQIGTPTSAVTLAHTLWALAGRGAQGLFHVTDAGAASWYDFAQAIAEEATAAGILAGEPAVEPIATADYPTPAQRPAYSVLDKSATWALLGEPADHWRVALRRVLAGMGE